MPARDLYAQEKLGMAAYELSCGYLIAVGC